MLQPILCNPNLFHHHRRPSYAKAFLYLNSNIRANTKTNTRFLLHQLPTIPVRHYRVDTNGLSSLLQGCTDIHILMQIHAHVLLRGLEQDVFVGAKLVNIYTKCGGLENARLVFDKIHNRNVFLWNAIIRGYARNGPWEEALVLYRRMQQEGIQPDNFTFPFVLKACASLLALQEGKNIHYHIARTGFGLDVFVATALVDMYAKCGSVEDARQVFEKMSSRDVVSWSAMIAGYAQNGYAAEALMLFNQMQFADVKPNLVTVVSVLPACAHLKDMQQGKGIHDYINRCGFESDVSVGNSLIDMYAKCGSIDIARQLFDKMPARDVVSWNTMITAFVQNGHANEALVLFHQMQLAEVTPDLVTLVSVLPACAELGALQQGKWIHDYIVQRGFESDVFVGTALINMYAKCGSIVVARKMFEKKSERNVVSWSAMIAGYAQNGHANDALTLFHQMQLAKVKPDLVTMVNVIQACAHLGSLKPGRQIHDYILRSGFESNVSVENSLIDTYAKCGSIKDA